MKTYIKTIEDIDYYTDRMGEAKHILISSFPSIDKIKEIYDTYCAIVLKLNYLKHLLKEEQ